jgi:hypothetical protein
MKKMLHASFQKNEKSYIQNNMSRWKFFKRPAGLKRKAAKNSGKHLACRVYGEGTQPNLS